MKKILSAVVLSAFGFSGSALAATDITVTLADGFLAVGDVATKINLARQGLMEARDDRAGFVKNDFEFTISANVIAGVLEEPVDSRFGVVAGSNKGYTVFTGSSVGGSISQCGDVVLKTVDNLAASEVKDGALDLDNANGCAR